jgi:hypothetical protein
MGGVLRRLSCFATALSALASVRAAKAEGRTHFDDRPVQAEVRLGFGTSVGLVGLAAEYSLLDPLALGMGIGTNAYGWQWEAHARLRAFVFRRNSGRLHAMTLEGAFSRGKFRSVSLVPCVHTCQDEARIAPAPVSWAQAELGWEMRAPTGFALRLASGFAWPIAEPAWRCEPQTAGCDGMPDAVIAVLSVALGYSF